MSQGSNDFAAYLNYLQGQQKLSLDPLQLQGAMGQMGQAQQANAARVSQNNALQSQLQNQYGLAYMGEQGQNARLDSMLPHQIEMEKLRQQGVSALMDKLMPAFGGGSGSGYGGFQTNYGASALPGNSPFARNPHYQPGVDRPVDGQAAGPSPFASNLSSPGRLDGPPSSTPQSFQPASTQQPQQQAFKPTGWASLPGYNPANNSFSGGTAAQVRQAGNEELGMMGAPYKNPNGNFTGPGGSYLAARKLSGYNPGGSMTRNEYYKQQPGYGPTTARMSANARLI